MFINDLKRFPAEHPPSPYGFPLTIQKGDKWGHGLLPPETTLCAVGWLGSSVNCTGETPEDCVDRLYEAYVLGLLFSDNTLGWHDCELCSGEEQRCPEGNVGPIVQWGEKRLRLYGHGHHLIRFHNTVYMCPALIIHYILDHHYRPPDEFIHAVSHGHFMTPDDLTWVEHEGQ